MNVRDDSRIVEIWLTREEQQDQAWKKKLKPLCQQYKAQKYLVTVFLSGARELAGETSALLCSSKRRIAELEVKRARTCGMDTGKHGVGAV